MSKKIIEVQKKLKEKLLVLTMASLHLLNSN